MLYAGCPPKKGKGTPKNKKVKDSNVDDEAKVNRNTVDYYALFINVLSRMQRKLH
jgi:hypothetical protein